jgi:hypothetical protein
MTRDRVFHIARAVANAICAILLWRYTSGSEGTELSGGRITGVLLNMADVAILLFVIALAASFLKSRLSGVPTLAASLLALPLYAYFIFPGPFRRILPGEYSVPATANFVWDASSLAGIIALGVALCLSIRRLLPSRQRT